MSFGEDFNTSRQVIPRWHTYPLARWLGVITTSSENGNPPAISNDFSEKIESWKTERSLLHASDLVGNALLLNHFNSVEAAEAASFILRNQTIGTSSLTELANSFIRLSHRKGFPLPHVILPEHTAQFHEVISSLKRRVRDYPRNPILWMDLAFYYCAVGQTQSAESAVKVALSLNSENRYLLRSGSRFFMHLGSPDAALDFLRKSDTGKHDPWLIAAEIAISDTLDRPSKRIKAGQNIIASSNIPKFHLSELAGALGTVELIKGSVRRGKKLFNLALEDPTENTLAQAAYLDNLLHGSSRHIDPRKLANSFEAETRLKFTQTHDYKGALEAAKRWFAYQPFSSRPAVSGSYIAGVALEDYEESAKIAKMGLLSSPHEPLLINNLAFALASLDRIQEARQALCRVKESEISKRELNVLTATRALIEYKSNNGEEGRKLYESAISGFKQLKDFRSEVIAKFYMLKEELMIKPNQGEEQLEDLLKDAKKLGIDELQIRKVADRVRRLVP